MRVLVTGSAGFLASRLVSELVRRGDEVVALDVRLDGAAAGAAFVEADIVDPGLTDRVTGGLDCVVHLAAIASPLLCERDPRRAFDVNVTGTLNVLKLALARGARRFVFASSAHCYGISPRYLPTDERHPLWLQDTYTTSKLLGEQLCRLFDDNHGLSSVILRLYNGFGPGQALGYFVPDMIAKARTQGRIELRGGEVTKDFVFVDDVVRALALATLTPYAGVLNIGSGRETSLGEVACLLAKRLNVPLVIDDLAIRATRMWCDRTRAERVLGWTPSVSLEDGLEATLNA